MSVSNATTILRQPVPLTVAQSHLGANQPVRLSIVVSHPIQHFCPLYRELSHQPEIDLSVVFGSDNGATRYFDTGFNRTVVWSTDILNGFRSTILRTENGYSLKALLAGLVKLWNHLDRIDPHVIQVYGYREMLACLAVVWAKFHRCKVLMVSDHELLHRRSRVVKALKRMVLPPLLRAVDGFLTCGEQNEQYYRHYGISWSEPQK